METSTLNILSDLATKHLNSSERKQFAHLLLAMACRAVRHRRQPRDLDTAPMRTSFLKTPQDLVWLRETQPATRPYTFACAIIEGNEDCPDRIILAERDHYQSIAVTLTRKRGADEYVASIGRLG